jgi:hypothetical protein
LSYNLMLNSGNKIRACAAKKNIITPKKKFWTKQKNHNDWIVLTTNRIPTRGNPCLPQAKFDQISHLFNC